MFPTIAPLEVRTASQVYVLPITSTPDMIVYFKTRNGIPMVRDEYASVREGELQCWLAEKV
jgi:hypothetical protein